MKLTEMVINLDGQKYQGLDAIAFCVDRLRTLISVRNEMADWAEIDEDDNNLSAISSLILWYEDTIFGQTFQR